MQLVAMGSALLIMGAVFLLVVGVGSLSGGRARKQVRSRLRSLADGVEERPANLVRNQELSRLPWLNRTLKASNIGARLQKTLREAGSDASAGTYVMVSACLGVAAFLASHAIVGFLLLDAAIAAAVAALPFLQLRRKRAKRMEKFQKQLPDALDLVARSLKAGHTFAGSMRMVADEMEDPIKGEFGATLDEINFGVDSDRALINLLNRVDCPDLKFFVVSVNIQRETGGNLAEIVGNIAHLIRERFKLLGRVRVLSAEGRLSAMILLALPFVIALVIQFLNPEYLGFLLGHPLGKFFIIGALSMMAMGYFIIRRMIAIKV